MAAVAAAAVTAAGMAFTVMMLTMVIALDVRIVHQIAGNQRFHCCISAAGNTAEQTDTGC